MRGNGCCIGGGGGNTSGSGKSPAAISSTSYSFSCWLRPLLVIAEASLGDGRSYQGQ